MKLKIPPPLIGLIFSVLMWRVSLIETPELLLFSSISPFSILLLLLGLSIDISALLSFRKAKTTINPMKPTNTSALVNTGIYKVSRNPMYLGLLLILCAWAVQLGSGLNILVLSVFVGYITLFQIIPEEKVLEGLFPVEFDAYKSKVRRWI